jgi:PKD repeat protein
MPVFHEVRPTLSRRLVLAALALIAAGAAFGDVVIPSSVYRRGAGGAEFRSDVRVFNPTSSPINFTPVLYDQVSGQTLTGPPQTISPRTQRSFDNIVGTLFGKTLDDGSFGPIRFQTSGAIVVSSSVNNYNACGNGAVSGQWLPGLDASAAVNAGILVQLASSVDLGSGYRTNVVFTNPGTQPATVTARVRKGDGSQLSSATLNPLGANGFVQIGNWASFPGVAGNEDTNLWLEFTSDQPVIAFASVINNASGDPFAIVMTAEPNVSSSAPVASYTVTPTSPGAGQSAAFTDTSSNSPTAQLWAFGDGTTATSGATVQHTYAAAGTYRTSHFASNAFGTSAAVKDVVVGTAPPIAVTISATTSNNQKWTFVCQSPATVCNGAGNNNATLKVGQPYTITWTTPQSEGKTHGLGGLAVLGIAQNDNITPNRPYVVAFTPSAGMVGVHTYACTVTQCAPSQAVHDSMTGTITIVP